MAVKISLSSTVRVDGFIDDLICVFLDTETNQEQAPHAVPLAMHITVNFKAQTDIPPITNEPKLTRIEYTFNTLT
jgi:hypothetical protein